MARENVEVVRDLYRGWALGDFNVGTEVFDPDIEFSTYFGPDRITATGLEDTRRVWGEHLSNWEGWRTGEIQELRDLGDRGRIARTAENHPIRDLAVGGFR